MVCARCGSRGGLPQRYPFPPATWQQPWIHEPPTDPQDDELAWMLELNDVRVHTPVNRTALVIPPESRIRRGTVVDRLYGNSRSQQRLRNARKPLVRRTALKRVSSDYNCTVEEIENALKEIDRGYPLYGRTITQGDLMASEYKALTEKIPDLKEDEDFVTAHHTSAWKALAASSGAGAARPLTVVDRLVAVHKLKEIMVLMGFRRAGGEHLTPPDITGRVRLAACPGTVRGRRVLHTQRNIAATLGMRVPSSASAPPPLSNATITVTATWKSKSRRASCCATPWLTS